jgi:transcriptional regulator with PAS, ATPase and Fis domain
MIVEATNRITTNTILHILPESRDDFETAYGPDLAEAVSKFEKAHIMRVLKQAKDNRSMAAKMLGISRSVLYEKLKRYKIE